MMTADHIAVTPYYGAPQSVAEQIGSLPELKYEQTNVGAVKVDVLGPRCRRAHRHGEARGDLQGQADTIHPLPSSPPHGAAGRPVEGAILPDHRSTALALSCDLRMR